jgi:hypothetical protein
MRRFLTLALLFVAPASAQVFKVDAGASTLFNANGASVTMFTPNNELTVGAGTSADHFTVGATDKFQWHDFDFVAGDNAVSLSTDSAGLSLPTRGLFVGKKSKRVVAFVFVAACGTMYSAPYFEGSSAHQFCAGYSYRFTTPHFEVSSVAAWSEKVTALESLAYNFEGLKLSATGGLLNDARLLNGAGQYTSQVFSVGASRDLYVWQGQQSTVDSFSASAHVGPFSINGSDFASLTNGKNADGQSVQVSLNLASTGISGASFWSRYGRQGFYGITERVGSHWQASAYVNTGNGSTSLAFGGGYVGNRVQATAGYNENYYPFVSGRSPWVRTLSASLTLKIHDTSVTVASVSFPNSKLKWSAFGEQYAYGRGDLTPTTHVPSTTQTGKYSVSVTVTDEHGEPVAFAVVYLAKTPCVTDEQGMCGTRFKNPQSRRVVVAVEEFPTGPFAVVDAPSDVTPTKDGASISVKVSRSSRRESSQITPVQEK